MITVVRIVLVPYKLGILIIRGTHLKRAISVLVADNLKSRTVYEGFSSQYTSCLMWS